MGRPTCKDKDHCATLEYADVRNMVVWRVLCADRQTPCGLLSGREWRWWFLVIGGVGLSVSLFGVACEGEPEVRQRHQTVGAATSAVKP